MVAWIQKRDGWLKDHIPDKRPVGRPQTVEQNTSTIYRPIRCTKCNSKNISTYKTELPLRYHKCKNCGHNFKSVEEE